jgi:tRNA (guanine37-N1)-methyltransferase
MDPQNNSHSVTKRTGFKVPKRMGEEVMRHLSQGELISRELQVRVDGAFLVIPFSRSLSTREKGALLGKFPETSIIEYAFARDTRPPKTLKEALGPRLPKYLLETLPSSYDIVGDIAVLDLPSDFSAYEGVLADAICQVNKNVRVVMAKTGAISGQGRILPTRHIAGENRTATVHKESGCRFNVDISKAYFSPRLSHEHERVVKQVEPGENVVDLFAGVGPFSIMIAKKVENVEVNAVDSNPDAVALIRSNVTLNRIQGNLGVWQGDARDVVQKHLMGTASRVIMNHPSASKEFVDVACNALRATGGIVHYYTFAEGIDCEDRAIREFENALGQCGWRTRWLAQVRRVRGISPVKWQVVVDAPVAPAG